MGNELVAEYVEFDEVYCEQDIIEKIDKVKTFMTRYENMNNVILKESYKKLLTEEYFNLTEIIYEPDMEKRLGDKMNDILDLQKQLQSKFEDDIFYEDICYEE